MDNMEEKKENLIQVDLREIMETSFLDYSMSVIVQRALPDVRDGLKPVHRRILYTMYENALWPEKAYRKCADTVGSVLGRYHPHGDASVYDALVRLAQDFSMRYMLIDGHGNFGSVDGDPPAAYRYTEARMSKLSVEMLKDIEKDTVDFSPNYDDRLKEPNVLPSHFPNILVNGSTGIAVGMATNIPPHNMGEVLDGVCAMVDNPDIDLDGLMQYIKGPDFPTGGIIMGRSGIRAAYGTGRGRIYVRARAEIVEKPNGRYQIVVTELPYQVNKARLIENIAELDKDKRIDGISNIDDHSDRNGMHIAIDIKREASPQLVLNHLYSLTQMQVTFGVIMLAIVDGQPKLLTLRDILREYIKFQSEVVLRRTQFDLKKAQERAHILEGLMIALDFIDEVIAILRNSKSIPEGKVALMERFGLDDVQAQAIVQMRLGQLTGLERTKLEEELAALRLKIADFLDIIASEARRYGIIKDEAMAVLVRSYGDARAKEVFDEMVHIEEEEKQKAEELKKQSSSGESLLQRKYIYPFVLAVLVLAFTQATGINSVLNYSVKVFQQAGLEGTTANWADFTIKVVNCLMTIVAMVLVDRKGRKFLLKIGTAGIVVGLLGTGFLFNNVEKARKDVTADVAALLAAQSPSVQKEFEQGKDVGSIRTLQLERTPDSPFIRNLLAKNGMADKDINRMQLIITYDQPEANPAWYQFLMGSSTQLSVVEFSELTKDTKDIKKEEDKASLAVIKAVPDSTNKMVVNGKDGYAMKPVSILKAELGEKPDTSMGWGVTAFFIIFIAFYATGPGVCVWLALSELMPARIRSNGMAIALLINQLVSTVIAGSFLPVSYTHLTLPTTPYV